MFRESVIEREAHSRRMEPMDDMDHTQLLVLQQRITMIKFRVREIIGKVGRYEEYGTRPVARFSIMG